jgi:hypothetical protein
MATAQAALRPVATSLVPPSPARASVVTTTETRTRFLSLPPDADVRPYGAVGRAARAA